MTELTFSLPDGKTLTAKPGSSFLDIVAPIQPQFVSPIVAVKLNHEIKELFNVPTTGGQLTPIDLTFEDGIRIYSRGLSFVFFRAATELYPGCRVRFEHSLSKGIYGEIDLSDGRPFTPKDAQEINLRMQDIIAADEPIIKETLPIEQAMDLFAKTGQPDKVRLFCYRKNPQVRVYRCGDFYDYFYGYMVPSTGFLKRFEVKYYLPGFILRYPTKESPALIPEFAEQRKLARIFYEFEKWGHILEVEDVGSFNDLIAAGKGGELIRIAEGLHEKKIGQIADLITVERDRIRIILIAGPSSSGKTTFAQRLMVQLRVNGLKPIAISLDDYFVDRDLTPMGPDGLPDYECIEAINVELFNEHLTALIQGVAVNLPRYDFQKGRGELRTDSISLSNGQPIIVEGIHGLNERLTVNIPKDHKFKIYVSALTQLNIDNHNRIATTDNRILRRIVRDNQFRGHDALRTIGMWPMVRRGEDNYIFPFQEEADVMFNSALIYELAVLKQYAEPLLTKITPEYPEYPEAKRLLKFLSYFLPLPDREVPINSILREFIGSSCFY